MQARAYTLMKRKCHFLPPHLPSQSGHLPPFLPRPNAPHPIPTLEEKINEIGCSTLWYQEEAIKRHAELRVANSHIVELAESVQLIASTFGNGGTMNEALIHIKQHLHQSLTSFDQRLSSFEERMKKGLDGPYQNCFRSDHRSGTEDPTPGLAPYHHYRFTSPSAPSRQKDTSSSCHPVS